MELAQIREKTKIYDLLKPKNYVNSLPVGSIAKKPVYLAEIALSAVFSGINCFMPGPKSAGKSQLMRDIGNGIFGGTKYCLFETGRPDFKLKDLFEKLNLSLAQGSIKTLPEIKPVYSSNGLEYLIQIWNAQDEQFTWQKISVEEKDKIIQEHTLTTDDLTQFKNLNKKFFCIDEYNRCPPVIMNLFYGLMMGELERKGKITHLGNGYYSGIAAANPLNYSGTFEMDPAMWARFPVILDFGAYSPSDKDKDEMIKKNLSPKVQISECQDLTPIVLEEFKKIKNKRVSLDERIILQYFQTGLGICHQEQKPKEHCNWPRVCAEKNCPDATKTCGVLKGIDARAIRAVFRLSKGLEQIIQLREGNLEFNTVDSLSLAFQFVAPYKGVLNPRTAKTYQGIEGLALKELTPVIQINLEAKLKEFHALINIEKGTRKNCSLARLQKQFDSEEYLKIEESIRKQYEITKKISLTELIKNEPEIYAEKKQKFLVEELRSNINKYKTKLLNILKELDEDFYQKLKQLDGAKTKDVYSAQLFSLAELLTPLVEDELSDRLLKRIDNKIKKEMSGQEIKYIPKTKEKIYQQNLKTKLQEKLKEKKLNSLQQRKKQLFKNEWNFLKPFYEECLNSK